MPRLHLTGGGAGRVREAAQEQLTITTFVAKGTFGQVFFAKSDKDPGVVAVKVTEPVSPARPCRAMQPIVVLRPRHACVRYLGAAGIARLLAHVHQGYNLRGRPCQSREEQIQRYLLAQRDLRGGDDRFDLLSLRLLADVDVSGCPAFARRKFMLFPRFGQALDLLLPIRKAQHRRFVAQQVLSALSLLHTMKPFAVCHRDLKPSNVLCDPITFQCVRLFFDCVRQRCWSAALRFAAFAPASASPPPRRRLVGV